MPRGRLVAVIAFAGLGLDLFQSPSRGFSQNLPAPRADRQVAISETQAAVTKYCTTCHNERARTAGLVLDAAGVAHPGDQAETWEKVLRQLRAGTMPPPAAVRPPQAFYTSA